MNFDPIDRDRPSPLDAALFALKASLLRLRRASSRVLARDVKRWPISGVPLAHVWSESVSELHGEDDDERRDLVLGKIENLRVALRSIHGVRVPASGIFSFWVQVGAASKRRGYVPGRELRDGRIIASIGGGICQLSNALYQAALDAGLVILERHAHSQAIPGSDVAVDRDATVFWNYIDLRFGDAEPFQIDAVIDENQLRVRILKTRARGAVKARPQDVVMRGPKGIVFVSGTMPLTQHGSSRARAASVRRPDPVLPRGQRTAFMVDGVWPEFDAWIRRTRGPLDTLLLPLDGKARGEKQYGWSTEGFDRVASFPLLTMWRSFASRKLSSQGAERQELAIRFRRRLASAYVKAMDYRAEHVVVTQELLPYVWELGALQGRTFDVLMTGLPMTDLQALLDRAAARHPDSPTLADFRAPSGLAAVEMAALNCARQIVTPHTALARLFPNVLLLPWLSKKAHASKGHKIVFPASTLGRKGAYELRAAARALKLPLVLMGPSLESPSFWDGIDVERMPNPGTLHDVAVMVLPAWVESRPTRLMQALKSGTPVIATAACGLPPQANLTIVPVGDVAALTEALRPYSTCA